MHVSAWIEFALWACAMHNNLSIIISLHVDLPPTYMHNIHIYDVALTCDENPKAKEMRYMKANVHACILANSSPRKLWESELIIPWVLQAPPSTGMEDGTQPITHINSGRVCMHSVH